MAQLGINSRDGVIILAAGLGRRMRSEVPKVLHLIGGKPILYHILHHVRLVRPDAPIAIVVGHGRERVESYVRSEAEFQGLKIEFIVQDQQLGTGHAARCVMDSSWGKARVAQKSSVFVIPGDLPLLSQGLLEQALLPLKKSEVLRLVTCQLSDPTGYGRIVRKGKNGPVLRIVEERDASPKEKQISEVGTSVYVFRADFLSSGLKRLSSDNAQKEFYLTDLVRQASRARKKMDVLQWSVSDELRGINDPWELAQAASILRERWIQKWARFGVHFLDPRSVYLDITVELEAGVTIYPGVILLGHTHVGAGSTIGPHVKLSDVKVADHVEIKAGTVGENSEVGSGSSVGPYAHLRPESVVGSHCKIGNFVELKKAKVGDHSSIAHLSYVGDAEVGKKVNIGCGFVTCNFDGRVKKGQRKHRTIIEDHVFLGSDCQVVAPIRIGQGAYIASGSTITEDVEPGALAIARSRQVNKPGYATKLKPVKEE